MDEMGHLSGFLAASGVTTGVLFWWAQIWRSVEDRYWESKKPTETAVVGSVFSYLGAIACIGALTAAVSTVLRGSPSIPAIAAGLFLFGLAVVLVQLTLSIVMLCVRLLKREQRGQPWSPFVKAFDAGWRRWGALIFFITLMLGAVVLTIIASVS